MVTAIDAERLGAYGVHVPVGDDEAQHRWRSDDRVDIYSVSKGVSALAAGIAVDDALLSLDTRVGDVLTTMDLGDGVERVTLRHLLTMTSGIDFAWFGDHGVRWPDLAQEMLRSEERRVGKDGRYREAPVQQQANV